MGFLMPFSGLTFKALCCMNYCALCPDQALPAQKSAFLFLLHGHGETQPRHNHCAPATC